jgi:hypothetical protein
MAMSAVNETRDFIPHSMSLRPAAPPRIPILPAAGLGLHSPAPRQSQLTIAGKPYMLCATVRLYYWIQ